MWWDRGERKRKEEEEGLVVVWGNKSQNTEFLWKEANLWVTRQLNGGRAELWLHVHFILTGSSMGFLCFLLPASPFIYW